MAGTRSTNVVIAGGGPAGMMCGYLLARAGVDVTVLEKHADFLRDFRGDTVHPSTLEVIYELGLLDDFLKLPHQKIYFAEGEIGDGRFRVADFTHLPTHCKFIVFMPQWNFLNFLAEKARLLPSFHLLMETEATGLLREAGETVGITARSREGSFQVRSKLTIAADGRDSRLRDAAGLHVESLGAPMDVLWFKLAMREGETPAVFGRVAAGGILVRLYRGDYWQCAFLIAKGAFDAVKREGLDAFRGRVAELAHRDNANEIRSWDDVRLLTVEVDRLRRWYAPGLLFVGDAAHAMSPVGGVGINLAIQDAVATANLLAGALRQGRVSPADLARVQKRRWFPTWIVQVFQTTMQNRVVDPVLRSSTPLQAPSILKLVQKWSWLQRIPARLIGIGPRPEHVSKALLNQFG